MNSNISLMKLSLYCLISLYFILVCLVGLIASSKPTKWKKPGLFCVVMVMVMQVITVFLK